MKKFSWKHLNSKIKLISATIVILMLVQMLVLIIVSNNRQTELFNSQASEAFSNNIVSMDEMLDYLKETTIAFSKQQNVYHLFFADHISRQDMQSFKLATGLIPNKVSSSIKNVYIFNEATNSIYANNMSVTHIDKLPESTTKSIICSGSSNGGKMKLFVDKEVFLVDAEMKHPEQMLRICYFPSKQLSSCIVMDVSISDLTALYDTYRKAFASEVFITSKNELSYGTGGPALQEAIKSQLSQLSNRDYRYPVFHNLQGTEYLVLKKTSANRLFDVYSLIPSSTIPTDHPETRMLFSINMCLIILVCLAIVLFLLFKNFNNRSLKKQKQFSAFSKSQNIFF